MGLSENVGYIPNEIAIFHRDNDQQNHWVQWGTLFSDTPIYTILPCYGYSTQFQECLTWTDPCPYPRKLCCCSLKPCLAPREEHIHFMDTPVWLKHSEPPRDTGHVAIFASEHFLTIQFIPILEYIIHVMPYPGQFLA